MIVGIDARALLTERTGIGVYTENIACRLAQRPGWEVILFAPRTITGRDRFPANIRFCEDNGGWGTAWVQTTLSSRLKREGCDVLLGAVSIIPSRGNVPAVAVIHDLTPLTHPEWHRQKTIAGFAPWIERTVARAARIIAVSRATARDVVAHFPEAESKTHVVENGVDPIFYSSADASESDRTRSRWTQGRRFLLYLGTLEPRKNLERLVAASEILWTKWPEAPDLLLAGGRGWKSKPLLARIANSPFRGRIHLAGYVSQEEAPSLYRAAEIFCYPSLAEGFGLPVLEAMACGAPVVISDAEALLEVTGGAALSAPAGNEEALATAIERLLADGNLREEIVRRGKERAEQFSWEPAAEKTAEILTAAATADQT